MSIFFIAYDKDTSDYWAKVEGKLGRTTETKDALVFTDREEFAAFAARHGYDRKRIKARLILYRVSGPDYPSIKYPPSTVAIKLKLT